MKRGVNGILWTFKHTTWTVLDNSHISCLSHTGQTFIALQLFYDWISKPFGYALAFWNRLSLNRVSKAYKIP